MNNLVQSNINVQITNLTPIEIALGIDEEGRTTARKLYEFLELAKGQFSRWAKTSILENVFAINNEDYEGFDINVEGNRTTDYKLSASFAKKLAMGTQNAKGEAAKNYFVKVEDKLKEKVQALDTSELSPELQMFNKMFQALANNEIEQKKLKEEIQGIRTVVALNSTDWKADSKNLIVKMAQKLGGNQFIQDVYKEIYTNLERRAGCQLSIRCTNKQKKMALEGVCKSKINAVSKLDIIGEDKKILECFLAITKELAIKYGV